MICLTLSAKSLGFVHYGLAVMFTNGRAILTVQASPAVILLLIQQPDNVILEKLNLGSHMGVNFWFAGLIERGSSYSPIGRGGYLALYALNNFPEDQNVTVSGSVQYQE